MLPDMKLMCSQLCLVYTPDSLLFGHDIRCCLFYFWSIYSICVNAWMSTCERESGTNSVSNSRLKAKTLVRDVREVRSVPLSVVCQADMTEGKKSVISHSSGNTDTVSGHVSGICLSFD